MDLTSKPNLKPFRDYSEHEIINGFFAANVVPMNKGTFVSIVPGASGNTNVAGPSGSRNHPPTPLLSMAPSINGAPDYAVSPRWSLNWKVKPAASGEPVLGVAVYDTKETNKFGEAYIYKPRAERNEQSVVASGQAVPILRRGWILTNSYSGVPSAGTGITHVINGIGIVGPYVKGTSVGKFISGADAEGYAHFLLEC